MHSRPQIEDWLSEQMSLVMHEGGSEHAAVNFANYAMEFVLYFLHNKMRIAMEWDRIIPRVVLSIPCERKVWQEGEDTQNVPYRVLDTGLDHRGDTSLIFRQLGPWTDFYAICPVERGGYGGKTFCLPIERNGKVTHEEWGAWSSRSSVMNMHLPYRLHCIECTLKFADLPCGLATSVLVDAAWVWLSLSSFMNEVDGLPTCANIIKEGDWIPRVD